MKIRKVSSEEGGPGPLRRAQRAPRAGGGGIYVPTYSDREESCAFSSAGKRGESRSVRFLKPETSLFVLVLI